MKKKKFQPLIVGSQNKEKKIHHLLMIVQQVFVFVNLFIKKKIWKKLNNEKEMFKAR